MAHDGLRAPLDGERDAMLELDPGLARLAAGGAQPASDQREGEDAALPVLLREADGFGVARGGLPVPGPEGEVGRDREQKGKQPNVSASRAIAINRVSSDRRTCSWPLQARACRPSTID